MNNKVVIGIAGTLLLAILIVGGIWYVRNNNDSVDALTQQIDKDFANLDAKSDFADFSVEEFDAEATPSVTSTTSDDIDIAISELDKSINANSSSDFEMSDADIAVQ